MEEGVSPGLPKNFWKSWADHKTRLPNDGEMHFQRGTGNQAATDHPQSGSRSETYSSPSSQELQSQRTSKAYKYWVSTPCPPDSTRQSQRELTRFRNFTTKITPLKS